MKLNRRQAVLGMTTAALTPAACTTTRVDKASYANATFAHGIASGDPMTTSVVLWTRISEREGPTPVGWTVATDPDFDRVVASGRTTTGPERDYTVKVIPQGLAPGTAYWYRFEVGDNLSATGRTRTLPVGSLDQLVIAVASCSNYPFGHFNAYEVIADDPDVDVVVHLGDYIYEYDENGYGGDDGRRLQRIHEPRHEIVSLDDYRTRHAQYKSDPGSLAMHAMHPLIHTWDDHESTNNPWMNGAQNHQPDTEGDWPARRARSLKAYYEWMPAREPANGRKPEERWAHYKFGDLASVITLETRHTARSEQVDLGANRDQLTDPDAAARFYANVVGADDRHLLSAAQESFLAQELAESVGAGRPWRVLANQTILANVIAPDIDEPDMQALLAAQPEESASLSEALSAVGKLGIPANMDAWDGYPAARERLYTLATSAGARDLLVLTGDTHVFWQNRLFDQFGADMGVELGTTAISSPRGFYQLGDAAMNRYDTLTAARNDSVVWTDGRFRGYVKLTLTRSDARAEFISVSTIDSRDYATIALRTARIVRSNDGTLRYA